MIITGFLELVLDVSLSKTHEKSPVIITSLSVCYELWLIVERKYIRCTALVELYTSHQTIRILNLVLEIFVYSYLSIDFCDGCFHVDTIRISAGCIRCTDESTNRCPNECPNNDDANTSPPPAPFTFPPTNTPTNAPTNAPMLQRMHQQR